MRDKKRLLTIFIVIVILVGGSVLYYLLIIPPRPGSPYVKEFQTKSNSYPNAIAVDNQGRVWFSLWNETAIGVLYPENGTVKTFHLPETGNPGLETWGIVADNSLGRIFFTDHISNSIWSFDTNSAKFTRYQIPTSDSFPYQIVLDSSGNAWFSESFAGKLGELTPQGEIIEYPVPKNGSTPDPTGLTIHNNTLWFTEPNNNVIGSFGNGIFKMFNTTGYIFSPVGITVDPRGNIWVTQHTFPGLVSEFNPSTHFVKTFATSYPSQFGTSLPYFIYSDSSGNIWFNEHYGNSIAFLDSATGSLLEYHILMKQPIPGNLSGILTMALSQNEVPYFTELFTGNIGMVNATVPLDENLSVQIPGVLKIPPGSEENVSISIRGSGESYLSAYVGNFTQDIGFSFAPSSGSGNFSSTLTIQNRGATSGVYFVTISDRSSYITASKIIEIIVL